MRHKIGSIVSPAENPMFIALIISSNYYTWLDGDQPDTTPLKGTIKYFDDYNLITDIFCDEFNNSLMRNHKNGKQTSKKSKTST